MAAVHLGWVGGTIQGDDTGGRHLGSGHPRVLDLVEFGSDAGDERREGAEFAALGHVGEGREVLEVEVDAVGEGVLHELGSEDASLQQPPPA